MKTTIAKLDQANWDREILKLTQEKFDHIGFVYPSGTYSGQLGMNGHEHPIVKKYYVQIEALTKKMRAEIKEEMDGLFK